MVRYFEVHPANPQQRLLAQVVDVINAGGLIAYPTDSGYALGCKLGNKEALERIKRLRQLKDDHHFTLVISEFAQLGAYVDMNNTTFRAVKAATPGNYTFILPATKEVPKVMQHPKKKTVGVRIPQHATALALLAQLGEPLMSTSLILPGEDVPLHDGRDIEIRLENELDAVLDSGDAGIYATTVVDLSGEEPEVLRVGAGDPEPFEA